jgi:anti-sigma regulatory factor (Ser/Thr protein kinase)
MGHKDAPVPVAGTRSWSPARCLCSNRAHVRHSQASMHRAVWPVMQPRHTDHAALRGEMTMQWPLRSSLPLGALPTATPCARLHARHVLCEWGLDAVADTAELLVSELVTNCVNASRATEGNPPVWLRLSTDKVRVLIEVWDGNIQPPEPRELNDGLPSFGDEGGRGLFLVAMLSERWNWYLTQEPEGKVVWCELAAQEPGIHTEAASEAALPRRTPRRLDVRPARAMGDLDTLRRVRNRLRKLTMNSHPRPGSRHTACGR